MREAHRKFNSAVRKFRQAESHYERLRNEIWQSNLRLVIPAAQRKKFGCELEDVVETGNIGLGSAIKRFDLSKGGALSTFAYPAITWEIQNNLHKIRPGIPDARDLNHLTGRMEIEEQTWILEHERKPSKSELSEYLRGKGWKENLIQRAYQARTTRGSILSLDARLENGEEGNEVGTLADCLAGSGKTPAQIFEFNEDLGRMRAALKHLDSREKDIITKRYGLDGKGSRTLKEIGDEMKITKERVRQIEKGALEKLRTFMPE